MFGKVLVGAIILLVTLGILFGWQFMFGKQIKKEAESGSCRICVETAGGMIGQFALKEGTLPRLGCCPKIPVEIKGGTKDEVMKELLDRVILASKDFGSSEDTFSRVKGRYCKKRYHPITFVNQDLVISKQEFGGYIEASKDVKLIVKIPGDIYTNKKYTILYVADYEDNVEGWMEWFLKGKRFESAKEAVVLSESNPDKLAEFECEHIV